MEQMDLLGALDFFGVKKLSSDCIVANVRAGQGSGVLPVRGVRGIGFTRMFGEHGSVFFFFLRCTGAFQWSPDVEALVETLLFFGRGGDD